MVKTYRYDSSKQQIFLLCETNFDEPAEPQTKLFHHGNREQGTSR